MFAVGSRNALDDLVTESFGSLTVIERAPNDCFGTVYWRCRCRCGETVVRRANTLRRGKFFTCGKMTCRFWGKVYIPDAPDSESASTLGWCHEWTGALKDTGYGVLKVPGQKKNTLAHVYGYTLAEGPITDGRWVLHKCDNRKCVRASHLFLGTVQDNAQDMKNKGRARNLSKKRLPDTARIELKADYAAGGFTHVALAERFGVSLQTVGRILRRGSNKEH